MKTIHTIFISLTLLLTASLCPQLSFAEETQVSALQNEAQNKDTQENKINSHTLITQEFEKQIPQDKIVQDKSTKEQIKKEPFFPVSEEPVPSFGWGNYFQGIGIMLLLLFAFWYILKLMRKYGNGRFLPNQKLLPRDSMYLEGQLPLGQGKSIVIVNVLGDRLVLGVTEKNINLLSKTGTNHAETFEELMEQVPFKNTPHA